MASRPLTQGEIALAESVFGNSINYDDVRIFDTKYAQSYIDLPEAFDFIPDLTIMAPDGNIYYPQGHPFYAEDISQINDLTVRSTFIHEMTHVLQYQQTGTHLLLQRNIFSDINPAPYYDYGDLSDITDFYALNIEQQAEIFRDYLYANETGFTRKGNTVDEIRSVIPQAILDDAAALSINAAPNFREVLADAFEPAGSVFGSVLASSFVGNNVFEQVGARTVGAIIGEEIGAQIGNFHNSLLGSDSTANNGHTVLQNAIDGSLDGVTSQLTAQSYNVLGTLIMAEVADRLGLDGFENDAFQYVAGDFTGTFLQNIADVATSQAGANLTNGFNIDHLELSFYNAIGAAIGNALASELVNIDNNAELMFSTVTGIYGGVLGATFGGPIGSTVGSFLGRVVGSTFYEGLDLLTGGWIGQTFEDDVIVYEHVGYNASSGLMEIVYEERKETGNHPQVVSGSQELTNAYLSIVNGVINLVGGKVDISQFENKGNDNPLGIDIYSHAYLGYHHGNNTQTGHDNYKVVLGYDEPGSYVTAINNTEEEYARLVNIAAEYELYNIKFYDGDLKQIRAFEAWKQAIANGELSYWQGESVDELMAFLQYAEDYQKYLDNSEDINILVSAFHDTPFAATWIATLLQSEAMNLNQGYTVVDPQNDGNHTNALNQANSFLAADGNDYIFSYGGDDTVKTYGGDDTVNGGSGNDLIDLGTGDDQVWSEDGNDTLLGGAGDDILVGGAGADSIDGGEGHDISSYANSTTGVTIRMDGTPGSGGEAQGDILLNIEQLFGSYYNDHITGSSGNDTINGQDGSDTIEGGDGNDLILGWIGNDSILGGAGNDTLSGEQNDVSVGGSAHNDTIRGGDGDDWIIGDDPASSGADLLYGDAGKDKLEGGAGNDLMDGGSDSDTLYGGAGADTLLGGTGIDLLYGDDGNDSVEGGSEDDQVYGGDGDDIIKGQDGNDSLYGDYGNDTIEGGNGADSIFGSFNNDSIRGGAGNDVLAGEDGNDTIHGEDGDDVIYSDGPILTYTATFAGRDYVTGGNGNDLIKTGEQQDTVYGGNDNDSLYGEGGDDILYGEAGDDSIHGGLGNDTATGGLGNDTILGYEGADSLTGNEGNDVLYGLSENDTIIGSQGNDTIYGDTGNDLLEGNEDNDFLDGWHGADTMDGGSGADTMAGGDGNDSLMGGDGNDLIYGDRQPDPDALPTSTSAILGMIDINPGFNSWGLVYQGESYNKADLISAPHEMLIINPSRDSLTYVPESETPWSASDIADIKASSKQVMGYVNLAKINTFWSDWDTGWTSNGFATGSHNASAPTWLGAGETATTAYVDFSDQGWKDLVFSRVGDMIDQGFNGTLLDDVLEYYSQAFRELGPSDPGFSQAVIDNAKAMRDFIIELGDFVDTETPGGNFKLIVNGAPYLLADAMFDQTSNLSTVLAASQSVEFLNAVDLVLVENYVSQNPTFIDYTKSVYTASGIPLLSIDTDQVTEQQRIQVITDAVNAGLMPYTTENTAYDTLNGTFLSELSGAVAVDGSDILIGGDGSDTLLGGGGSDTLDGGAGQDTLTGGAGADVFKFSAITDSLDDNGANNNRYDQITAFEIGTDKIDLTGLGFTGLDTDGGNTEEGELRQFTSGGYTYVHNDQTGFDFRIGQIVTLTNNDFIFSDGSITGTSGNDSLVGTSADETFLGLGGNDTIDAGGGADSLDGGDGNDSLLGGNGIDTLVGGAGADTMDGGGGNKDLVSYLTSSAGVSVNMKPGGWTAYGDAAGDVLINIENISGSQYNDTLTGNAEGNEIYGNGGNDSLIGGEDNSSTTLEGADTGDDTIHGGDGDDVIDGKDGSDWVYGDAGNDTVRGGTGNDSVYGGEGSDSINGQAGDDYLYGMAGGDGSNNTGDDTIYGGDGNDTVTGSGGNDSVNGENGNDYVDGKDGNDLVYGGAGNDSVYGGIGADTVYGGWDDDYVSGQGGNDIVYGQEGKDYVDGGDGDDVIYGDSTSGAYDNDTLIGGNGNDTIFGNGGDDQLTGKSGADNLTGGDGSDSFIFLSLSDSSAASRDVITDFTKGTDKINFSGISAITGMGSLTISLSGGNTHITASGGFDLELIGDYTQGANELDAGDFVF